MPTIIKLMHTQLNDLYQTSNMHKIKGGLIQILAYVQYGMMCAKISSKHDNMHNSNVNYAEKSLNNNQLNV